MVKIAPIYKGVVFYDDDKYIGRIAISVHDGQYQLHSESFGIPAIRVIRTIKEMTRDIPMVFTGCYDNEHNLIRALGIIGFVKINKVDNLNVFVKENICH